MSLQQPDTLYRLYLVATIVGVGVFLWQAFLLRVSANAAKASAEAAKKAANISEQTLKLTQRADVLIDRAGIENTGEYFGAHSRLVVVFKNFGHTRAQNVRFHLSLTIPETERMGRPPEIPVPVTLGAGDEQRISFQSFGETFTQESFRQIITGQVPLRFDGNATYKDIFNDTHTTKFGGLFHPPTRTFIIDKSEAD